MGFCGRRGGVHSNPPPLCHYGKWNGYIANAPAHNKVGNKSKDSDSADDGLAGCWRGENSAAAPVAWQKSNQNAIKYAPVRGHLFLIRGEQQMNYLQLIERKFAKYFRVSARTSVLVMMDMPTAIVCVSIGPIAYTPCVRYRKISRKMFIEQVGEKQFSQRLKAWFIPVIRKCRLPLLIF